jgi:hypothetical protein
MQATPKRLDRGGDAVDPRKINIRDHQNTHAGTRYERMRGSVG